MKKQYVDEQMLYCVRNNQIFPQDIQLTKNEYLTFGSVGLTCTKLAPSNTYEKHINYWNEFNAEQINKQFNEINYELRQ